jgi:FkbM family methyltransferase
MNNLLLSLKQFCYGVHRRIFRYVDFRGLRIPLDNPPVSRKIHQQLRRKTYEFPEINAILQLLSFGDRVLEIGSGLGIVSSLVAKSGKASAIRSYEANPDLLPFIAKLHSINSVVNVELVNQILLPSPSEPYVNFHIHKSFAESSVLQHHAVDKIVSVETRDVNSVLKEFSPQILVCDIEGGESILFKDIDLGGIRALVIELHPAMISRESIDMIYQVCDSFELDPVESLSSQNVVAFVSAKV